MITRIPNGMEDEILFFMKSVDDYIGHIIGLRPKQLFSSSGGGGRG
jgi:hypothetical protein